MIIKLLLWLQLLKNQRIINKTESIKVHSYSYFHCKLRCLDIDNGIIYFTTVSNETIITKNIKEFYINDIRVDIDANTIQNNESLNVKNC